MSSRFSWKIASYLFLGLYVGFVVFSMYRSIQLMEFVHEHPEKVNFAAHELKGRIVTLRACMPAILSNGHIRMDRVKEMLTAQWDAQDLCLEEITGLFRGDPRLLAALRLDVAEHRKAVTTAAETLGGKVNLEEAEEYYEKNIEPKVLKINTCLARIMHSSFELARSTRQSIRRQMEYILYTSILFGILLIVATILVDRQVNIRNRVIANREHMVNIISQNLDEIFIIANSKGAFQYVSSASERVFGQNPASLQASPRLFYDFLPPDARAWLKNAMDGGLLPEKQFTFAKNGKFFRLAVYNVRARNGLAGSHIIALGDQTESARIDRNLSDALANACVANTAKSAFINRMTQELDGPVKSIFGLAASALHHLDDLAVVEESLREISLSASHIDFIINDVRDISHMGDGQIALSRDTFNMREFIMDIAEKALPHARARDQSLELTLDECGEDKLVGDTARLRQVIVNILSNAIKFTPPEGAIMLKAERIFRNEKLARFRFVIVDSGKGMSPEFLEKLFVPFERGADAPRSRNGGSGLGMPVAYNLVALMGGVISVKSRMGEGTEFTVEIPFDLAKTDNENAEAVFC